MKILSTELSKYIFELKQEVKKISINENINHPTVVETSRVIFDDAERYDERMQSYGRWISKEHLYLVYILPTDAP